MIVTAWSGIETYVFEFELESGKRARYHTGRPKQFRVDKCRSAGEALDLLLEQYPRYSDGHPVLVFAGVPEVVEY
jgi:hypothetical protein